MSCYLKNHCLDNFEYLTLHRAEWLMTNPLRRFSIFRSAFFQRQLLIVFKIFFFKDVNIFSFTSLKTKISSKLTNIIFILEILSDSRRI